MPINKFDPKRVNPKEENYDDLLREWNNANGARHFTAFGLTWMQIRDVEGICFVPFAQGMSGQDMYDSTSLGPNHK